MAELGLRFCARAFSSCSKQGPLFIAVHGPQYRGLSLLSTGSRCAGSVVVAHGPSCSAACGIFPDKGSNPCPLHWQADSHPLRHQGGRPPYHLLNFQYEAWAAWICHEITNFHVPLRYFWTSLRGFRVPSGPCPSWHTSCSTSCRHRGLSLGSTPWKCPISGPGCSLQGHCQVHRYPASEEGTHGPAGAGPHCEWRQASWAFHGNVRAVRWGAQITVSTPA